MARRKKFKREQFAEVRKTAGYTQEQLAEALNIDRGAPSRWETGVASPSAYLRPKLAKLLKVSPVELNELLWSKEASRSGGDQDTGAAQEAGLTPTDDEDQTRLVLPFLNDLTEFSGSPDELATLLVANPALFGAIISGLAAQGNETHDQLDTWRRVVDAMKRRGLLQLLGTTTASALVPHLLQLNPDEQERFAGAIATPRRVDAGAIAHSEAILLNAVLSSDKLGPQSALHTVLAQRRLLQAWLGDCPDKLRLRLLSVLSNTSRVAGALFFDTDNFTSASYYHEKARAGAHEARDAQLAAFTLANMSQVAQWADKPNIAIDHAVAAHTWAERTDNAPLKAYASDMTACSYAAIGDYDTAMHHLTHTEAQLPACQEQVVSKETSPFLFYSSALHIGRRGMCLLKLGRASDAVAAFGQALTLYAPQADQQDAHTSDSRKADEPVADPYIVRGIAVTKLELGQAYVLTGDIDEAAAILGNVAELVAQNRTDRLTKKLHTVRSSLQPWQDTRAVRELDEGLRAYGLGAVNR
jgi:transcriptional regulator with XRE-family HTH domain/tetratricopeptide (TPR) repeat protein